MGWEYTGMTRGKKEEQGNYSLSFKLLKIKVTMVF